MIDYDKEHDTEDGADAGIRATRALIVCLVGSLVMHGLAIAAVVTWMGGK